VKIGGVLCVRQRPPERKENDSCASTLAIKGVIFTKIYGLRRAGGSGEKGGMEPGA